MAQTRVTLNIAGFNVLRTSPEVVADLTRRADRIAAAAGDGFVVRDSSGSTRGRVQVVTDTPEAMKAEAEDAALTSAIDAGR